MSDRKNMVNKIKKGMKVYDNSGDEIGTVEFIHFSEADGRKRPVAATPPEQPTEPDLVDFIRKMFGTDKLPQEIHERLLMRGFIRMDSAKLFGSDRYAMFDQIDSVDSKGVHLGVANMEDLLKA